MKGKKSINQIMSALFRNLAAQDRSQDQVEKLKKLEAEEVELQKELVDIVGMDWVPVEDIEVLHSRLRELGASDLTIERSWVLGDGWV